LYEHQTHTPVYIHDGDGSTQLLCIGAWNSPGVVQKFRSALQSVLWSYGCLKGTFCEMCPHCVILQRENTVPGTYVACVQHAGRPRLIDTGGVLDSNKYSSEELAVVGKFRGHEERGAEQLLPGDIRDLRNRLVGNNLEDFQMYVMILIGFKLFLRCNELLLLRVEDFDMKQTVLDEDDVRAVVLWIQGKSDRGEKGLGIFADELCPEFCPLRHLLVYLAVTKLKSGFLFPTWTVEQSTSTEGLAPYKSPNSYSAYVTWYIYTVIV
jgi:hypothetical protein